MRETGNGFMEGMGVMKTRREERTGTIEGMGVMKTRGEDWDYRMLGAKM